jgi:hypothetical protein
MHEAFASSTLMHHLNRTSITEPTHAWQLLYVEPHSVGESSVRNRVYVAGLMP